MSKELVISASRHETRVAVIEDDQVVEVYHERENEYSLAGSIHKGRVTRVLPGMQSAFVDIGLERDAFLYVSDFFEDNEEYDKIVTSVEEKVLKLDRVAPAAAAPVTEPQETPAPAAPAVVEPAAALAPGVPAVAAPPATPARETHDDRDRRGRRSRRRRGQKGARGLPDSKFYSPRTEREPAPQPEAEVEEAEPVEKEDMLVLPGESLAKYSQGDSTSPQDGTAAESEPPEAELALAAVAPEDVSLEAAVEFPEAVPEPPANAAEPENGALPGAFDPVPPVDHAESEQVVAPAFTEPAEAAESFAWSPTPEETPVEEPQKEPAREATFAEVDASAGEYAGRAGAPEQLEAAAESAETALEPEERTAGEPSEPVAVGEEAVSGEQPGAEEEGPEPARIPTSLTATLREQGPRYLHRVSRRMRRKGGRGLAPEGPREARPQEARPPEPRSETRTVARPEPGRQEKLAQPSISDLLKEGQEIIVQIAKEPLGQKGARITSHIALPGRFLVYMPTVDHIGVSRKIPSEDERSRLKRILQTNRSGISGGFIVRTAGEGRSEEELRADMMFLYNLWLDLRQKAERKPAPALVHHDLNVVERVLRDQLTATFKSIWVDNEELYESVLRFVQRFQPALVNRVKLYTRANPVFDEFGITQELEKALRPKVWLKSGGYIVINQTEALVAIDINTGKYVGKSNRLEDTIVKTNTDAIREIVRQIRLRDLGGIIVVDFIDMDERKNRQKVMQALEEAMRADRAPYKILQFNDFGLVAITRKRVKQSLERTLCTPCPYCEGAGYVKSPQTVVGEILQEAGKVAKVLEGKDVMLRVAPDVAKLLKSSHNAYLQEIEEILGRTVIVKSDAQLHQDKFDLV
jgi:ribonuclease G